MEGARFSAPVQTVPGAHSLSLLHNGYRLSFPGAKQPERGVVHTLSSTEVKEGVELYHYFASGPSRPVLGLNFSLLKHGANWSALGTGYFIPAGLATEAW